ncbi:ShlB/FhaC/HecB family hemolysin secretion/activation protein [Plectonema radiosum NIES-515]|uniref:ShlB/FhaC/HecB family hemolysin secretion/activation protein n=1 Tax=Plectonema radiosum NIES-515 TaxID=2986073 RepID=A0ABT3AY80_9CYAN|nr:ShlB/FhaC/HecB family hemolysin secretion/activation protein [Plectonema radiosum]MCV3214085.1 ShlB/FhaC/HecB family hemolysin secretion/activation protein [Plectonema radiosum NIES-515]
MSHRWKQVYIRLGFVIIFVEVGAVYPNIALAETRADITIPSSQTQKIQPQETVEINDQTLLDAISEEFPASVNTAQILQPIETAQTQPSPDIFPRPDQNNPLLIPDKPPILPPPEELFPSSVPPSPTTPEVVTNQFSGTIRIDRFNVIDNTVFSPQEFAEATKEFINKPITFAQLLQASEAVTKLYRDKGYITSGAFIPANQTFRTRGSTITIQVVEGGLESIQIRGLKRLNPNYLRSRLAVATGKPLNVNKLLQALQLLQLNPLIKSISAELATGASPGSSILIVRASETKTFTAEISLDNNRSPSIGSFQRQIQLKKANLSGLGDNLNVAYANTDGSNDVEASYTLPINAYNGTLQFSYNYTNSRVIEKPFDILDIQGTSQDFSITLRQPIVQTPNEEFALGVAASRRESDVGFLESIGERLPFPSPGARDGETRLSILRFFQDWTKRNSRQVLAGRSQFSFGIDAFDATINPNAPDGQFFSWRGQGQWVRLLAPDTLLLVRADAQLSDRPLVPLEQFGLGGQRTVRGYRQDLLLVDKAFLASIEFRYPILRLPQVGGVLQITPFVDFGTGSGGTSTEVANAPNSLASTGLGLLWQSDRINARFDWGIPLVSVDSRRNSLQEDGLYFSVVYTQPF